MSTSRLLAALPAALLLAVTVFASASAADGDWRPPRADRLALFDAAMAPTLAAFRPALDAVLQDVTTATSRVPFTAPGALVETMRERSAAADVLIVDLAALRGLASTAVGILRDNRPDPCFAEYHAVVTTGWLLVGDSTASLEAGDVAVASSQIGAGAYLLEGYGDLVHSVAVIECLVPA